MRLCQGPLRKPILLLSVLVVAIAPACAQISIPSVLSTVDAFIDQFQGTTFGPVVSIGSKDQLSAIFKDNIFRVSAVSGLATAGKFYPPNALAFGGPAGFPMRRALLEVRDPDGLSDPITIWHESLHFQVYMSTKQPCLPEEIYMALCEDRVAWLQRLAKFDQRYKSKTYTSTQMNKEFENIEKSYENFQNASPATPRNLGGPYTNTDPDGSCGKQGASYTLSKEYVAQMDSMLGMSVDLDKIRPLYRFRTFDGNWKTTWGALNVSENAQGTVKGTYSYKTTRSRAQGKLEGTEKDGTFSGKWTETAPGAFASGTTTLTITEDGKKFDGTWVKTAGEAAQDQGEWSGTRVQPPGNATTRVRLP